MIEIIAYGALGLIAGSFLNVLVIRNGVRALGGRSACMSCGDKILWFDLLPVISFVILGGRCRTCSSKISMQYPLVELLTASLFASIGASPLPFLSRALGLPIAAALIAIAVYDKRHTIIPDAWVWTFNALAFSSIFLSPLYPIPYTLWSILAGPFTALPLFLLWLMSRGQWMGLGDAKLALGIGWLLGPVYGVEAVFLAFILGAVISIFLVFFSSPLWARLAKRSTKLYFSAWGQHLPESTSGFTMKSEMPFGPFLVAACFLVWLSIIYGINIPFLWQ